MGKWQKIQDFKSRKKNVSEIFFPENFAPNDIFTWHEFLAFFLFDPPGSLKWHQGSADEYLESAKNRAGKSRQSERRKNVLIFRRFWKHFYSHNMDIKVQSLLWDNHLSKISSNILMIYFTMFWVRYKNFQNLITYFYINWTEVDLHSTYNFMNVFMAISFWPRGFADAVLGTAYLLLFLFLLLEKFFEFHEKSGHSLHC